MIRTEEDHLAHYGILRRSGRYPWGSGGTEASNNKRNRDLLDDIHMLRKSGMSDAQIARGMGMTRNQLTARRSIAIAQRQQEQILTARRYKEKGLSGVAIGQRMNLNESSVRALLAEGKKEKVDMLQVTANMIKDHVDKKDMIQIGSGVENQLGITKTRLNTAVAILKEKGYQEYVIHVPGTDASKFTKVKVLAKPGISQAYANANRDKIHLINSYSEDYGRSYNMVQDPISINSRRIHINYADKGGKEADGVIYVRPGVKDLTIGNSQYAQVRIAVDGTHYLKGMAVYKDDLPSGVDLVFNTNKSNTGRKKDAMKEMDLEDPDLPFGAIIRQIHGPDGKVISAMNMIGSPTKEGSGEAGSWDRHAKSLSSQFLSKQSPDLAEKQLKVTHERLIREFDEINSLTNPTVRKDLLLKFANKTDSSAVHLEAASLHRQATKVLLPISSIKPNQIYAPTMRHGERVVLIRYPHAGTFEIPELTVNNRNQEARKLLGTGDKIGHDAIGIHHTVAQHLSGADFDGDFVLVIPNNKNLIQRTSPLENLKDFDPLVYKIPKDSPIPRVNSTRKGREMGGISNLITDMTLKGANTSELSRAVRHSMVVIDSENHELNIKQSEIDHGILSLKEIYQGGKRAGATTLISLAGAETRIDERKARPASQGGPIDPRTGKMVFVKTNRMKTELSPKRDPITGKRIPTGRMVPRQSVHDRLAITDNAFDLVSPANTTMENVYAEHSNKLKALANMARKETLHIKGNLISPSAKAVYTNEVRSLDAKLNLAKKNRPLERQAQLLTQLKVSQKRQANPGMDAGEVKKIKQQALNEARIRTGAHKEQIKITQSEWDAIQAGAISTHKLEQILTNSDPEIVKRLALPREARLMSSSMKGRAQSMLNSGYTQAEVADHLGIGLTTLKVGLSE